MGRAEQPDRRGFLCYRAALRHHRCGCGVRSRVFILLLPSLAVALPLIDTAIREVLRRVAPALAAAAIGGFIAFGLGLALVGRLPVLVLALQVAGLTGAYIAGLWIMDRGSVRELIGTLPSRCPVMSELVAHVVREAG